MDDLLQRLLAVDRQGDSAVKAAEEKAVQLREASAARIAALNAAFSKELSAECAAVEAAAVEEAERQRDKELAAAKAELSSRRARLEAALSPRRPAFLEALLGLEGGRRRPVKSQ